jgi:hypothetical protein
LCQVVFSSRDDRGFLVHLTALFHLYRLWRDKPQDVFEKMSQEAVLASCKILFWTPEKNRITVSASKLRTESGTSSKGEVLTIQNSNIKCHAM